LMDARYSDGEGMSDELVLSESMQLLVAGHETSSNALSWLLYLLSSRPDCLERLRLLLPGERPHAVNAANVSVSTFRTPCVCLQQSVSRTL
jgi:cytochrome P450